MFSVGACFVHKLTTMNATIPGTMGKTLAKGTVMIPKMLNIAVMMPAAAEAAAPFVVPRFQ